MLSSPQGIAIYGRSLYITIPTAWLVTNVPLSLLLLLCPEPAQPSLPHLAGLFAVRLGCSGALPKNAAPTIKSAAASTGQPTLCPRSSTSSKVDSSGKKAQNCPMPRIASLSAASHR